VSCNIVTVREVAPYQTLKRCTVHGIAFVADGTTGTAASAHPNVARMSGARFLGYKRPIACRGWVYNTASIGLGLDGLSQVAADACQCGGYHGG
jgi:hypothetical protein